MTTENPTKRARTKGGNDFGVDISKVSINETSGRPIRVADTTSFTMYTVTGFEKNPLSFPDLLRAPFGIDERNNHSFQVSLDNKDYADFMSRLNERFVDVLYEKRAAFFPSNKKITRNEIKKFKLRSLIRESETYAPLMKVKLNTSDRNKTVYYRYKGKRLLTKDTSLSPTSIVKNTKVQLLQFTPSSVYVFGDGSVSIILLATHISLSNEATMTKVLTPNEPSNTEITRAKDFTPTFKTDEGIEKNDYIKFIPINERIRIQLPTGQTYFGYSEDYNKLAITIEDEATLQALRKLDDYILDAAVKNSKKWLGGKYSKEEMLQHLYTPILSEGAYDPKVDLKVKSYTKISLNGETVQAMDIAPQSVVTAVFRPQMIWLNKSKFGCSVVATDIQIDESANDTGGGAFHNCEGYIIDEEVI